MILTTRDIKDLLVEVMERITGLKDRVVIETETGPRPGEGLYCSLWFKGFEPLPQNVGDYRTEADEDGESLSMVQHLRNETYCTVQVTFRGTGAFEAATASIGWLQMDGRNFDLWKILGFGGVDALQEISMQYQGRIEPRCFFDLSFYACLGADYPVDWFDTSIWHVGEPGGAVTVEIPRRDIPPCLHP